MRLNPNIDRTFVEWAAPTRTRMIWNSWSKVCKRLAGKIERYVRSWLDSAVYSLLDLRLESGKKRTSKSQNPIRQNKCLLSGGERTQKQVVSNSRS
ncbi:MAG: hypothetical protein VCD31_17025, partial [Alphaproteobacteria bacterium]